MLEVDCNRTYPPPAAATPRARATVAGWLLSRWVATTFLTALLWTGTMSVANGDADPGQTDALNTTEKLAKDQRSIAEKYQTLELLMLKMAEFDAGSNPQRSALLKQALLKSKDGQISQRMANIAAMLQQEQLRQAGEGQGNVRQDLASILEMLLSENRSDRLKDEQDRVRRYIKDVERVLRLQRSVQGRTESGADTKRLGQDQSKVADRTGALNQEIKDNELSETETDPPQQEEDSTDPSDASETDDETPSDETSKDSEDSSKGNGTDSDSPAGDESSSQSSDDGETPEDQAAQGKPAGEGEEPSDGDSQTPDDKEASDKQADGESSAGEPKPSDGKPAEGKPSDGQPADGKPSEGNPSETPPGQGQQGQAGEPQPQPQSQQPQFPGQPELEQAEQQMRKAQQQLDKSEREGAIEAQKKARQLLEQAKAQLEEILRQMREEEVERALAMLETRFRKMLEMQVKIFEDTEQLAAIPAEERGGQVIVQSGKLSVEERNVLTEVDKALLLLREEGSSVAFPEAVEQLRDDIFQIVERLAAAKIDLLTVGLEQDAIDALQEIIEALQKAQQDAEKRRQQASQGQGGGQSRESPLVDAIAEVKMIRALQMRVNRRTQTYSRILADPDHEVGQATDEDLVASLQALAEREERIQQVTRDIVLEKNK